jgi:hypothetical protein
LDFWIGGLLDKGPKWPMRGFPLIQQSINPSIHQSINPIIRPRPFPSALARLSHLR